MIPISDLEIFSRVVTAGNMSAAGRELGLSPAVISKRIGHLEKRLGTRLFQRTTRQIRLTETGKGFFDRITDILAGIDEAEAFVSQCNKRPGGLLKVAAPSNFACAHLAPYLAAFMAEQPELEVELSVSDHPVDLVAEGFDVAIRVGGLDDSSLVARKLAPCRRVLCAAPAYLEQAGIPQSLDDLYRFNCVTTVESRIWRLEGPQGPVAIRVSGNLRTNSSEVVRAAILGGLGIGFRSVWDIASDLDDRRLSVLLPEYREVQGVGVYAVYPSRQFLPAKLRVFLDFLGELYRESEFDVPDIHEFAATGNAAPRRGPIEKPLVAEPEVKAATA